jgi:hypothetical protein
VAPVRRIVTPQNGELPINRNYSIGAAVGGHQRTRGVGKARTHAHSRHRDENAKALFYRDQSPEQKSERRPSLFEGERLHDAMAAITTARRSGTSRKTRSKPIRKCRPRRASKPQKNLTSRLSSGWIYRRPKGALGASRLRSSRAYRRRCLRT